MLLKLILLGVVLPGAISGVMLLLAWRPWRKDRERRGLWGAPLALGAGFATGQIALQGFPPFPPIEATHWIPLLVLAAILLGIVEDLPKTPRWIRWTLRVAIAGVVPYLLLRPMIANGWTAPQTALWLSGIGVATLALWVLLDGPATKESASTVTLLLGVVAAGSGAVLLLSGSILLGQLAGALGGAVGVAFLISLWNRGRILGRGAVPVFLVGFVALGINGAVYADMTLGSALLLGLALAMAVLLWIPPIRRLGEFRAALVCTAAALLPLAASVLLALQASPAGGYD